MLQLAHCRIALAAWVAAAAAGAQTVYVDLVYPGPEAGTALQPFDTIAEGVAAVTPGGTVTVLSNDSHETISITKALTLTTQGGPVRVGTASSPLGSGAPLEWLCIVEIMYNPADGGAEYLELQNTGPVALDVSGVQFTQGITFTFPAPTVLAPGEFRVLVRSTDASLFSTMYPGATIGGFYAGALDNAGETLQLSTASGVVFLTVAYDDGASWPGLADGGGFSLVIRNPQGNPSDPANWRASGDAGGSPGAGDTDPNNPTVVINEVLAHTDPPQYDSVELLNVSSQTADVRGWFLSDDKNNPQKARVPSTSEFNIPPGGYATLDEFDFAPPPDGSPGAVGTTPLPGFRLSSFGEEVYLFSATPNGVLTGYMHGFEFGASENGVSFGRVVTSEGREHFATQSAPSLGSPNPGPTVGPLVISEIHYNPVPGGIEYVVLTNRSGATIDLYDTSVGGDPSNTHRISGIDFAFPPNTSLPAGANALIVNAPPTHYVAQFAPAGIQVFGPFGNYQGANSFGLSNADETLRVLWAAQEDFNPDTNALEVPYIAMDTVRYDDDPPWPNADNNFMSIHRTTLGTFGSEPSNWTAQTTSYQPAGAPVAAPVFSLARGFYPSMQSLAMSTTTPGATVYYTLDGSLPAPGFGTSQQYLSAITVSSSLAVRAAAYKAGSLPSGIASATYLINAPAPQRGAKAIAIVADPQESLFTPRGAMAISGGTYVVTGGNFLTWVPNLPNTSEPPLDDPFQSGTQTWMNLIGDPVYPSGGPRDPGAYNNALLDGRFAERTASLEYLDPNDTGAGLQVDAGIRVHGSAFRRPRYAMNPAGDWTQTQQSDFPTLFTASYLKFSLRTYFRSDYGPPKLTWNIFPGDTLLSYDKVVLRGGHNDGYNPFIRDELARRLYRDMGRVSARGEIYNLFMNGVYRGYYNVTERHDAEFLASRFPGTSKNWDVVVQAIDLENDPHDAEVVDGDRVAWDALMAAASQNLANTSNYDAVAAMLDIDGFIDYLLLELYAGNIDWPNNNWCAARERVPGAKWRFLVWDVELGFLSDFLNQTGIYNFPFWSGGGLTQEDAPVPALYRALVVNPTFRTAFQTRAQLHLGPGGALDTVNVNDRHDELEAKMLPILPTGVSYDDFIVTGWVPNREAVLIPDLQAEGLYP